MPTKSSPPDNMNMNYQYADSHEPSMSIPFDAAKFNSDVYDAIEHYQDNDYSTILYLIIETFLGESPMDAAACKTYLWQKRDSTLRSDLNEAYHSRDFVGILLNDAMLPEVVERAVEQGITLNPISGSQQDQSLQSAFVNCYIGDTAKLLAESLNEEYAAYPVNTAVQNFYNSIISVIQPSGMGKLRMVEEARNNVFTIPTHVCEEAEDEKIGHPLPDGEIDPQQLFEEDDVKQQADYEVLLGDIYVRARESVMVQQAI